MPYNTTPLVLRSGVRPTWLPDGRFWYRITTENGSEAFLVDPVKATKVRLRLSRPVPRRRAADAGRGAGGRRRPAAALRTQRRPLARRQAHGVHPRLEPLGARRRHRQGNAAHHRRRQGLRLRHRQRRLGAAATGRSCVWSPDSKQDRDVPAGSAQRRRDVPGRHRGRPPEAAGLEVSAARRRRRHDDPARRHRRRRRRRSCASRCRPISIARRSATTSSCRGGDWADVQWSAGRQRRVAFVSTSRDHKQRQLRVADAATGAVRDVLEEKVATFFESGNGRVNWRYLPASNEVIWFSRARQLGPALSLRPADRQAEAPDHHRRRQRHAAAARRREARGCCSSRPSAREKGRDPYFRHLYRVGMDGKNACSC